MRNLLRRGLLSFSASAIFSLSLSAIGLGSFVTPAAADWPCGMEYVNGNLEFNPYLPCMRPPNPERAPLPDVWGAIAIAPSLEGWGTLKFGSEATARAMAIKDCNAHHHTTQCRVVVTVPDVCAALAVSAPDNIFTIGGPIGAVNVASDSAMMKCLRAGGRSCIVKQAFCADGIGHVQGETIYPVDKVVSAPQGGFGGKR